MVYKRQNKAKQAVFYCPFIKILVNQVLVAAQ